MDDLKNDLLTYAKYVNDPTSLSDSEMESLSGILDKYESNDEVRKLLVQIKETNDYDKSKKAIEELIQLKEADTKDEEEMISLVYGVDIRDIQHKKLSDGDEVFIFFSDELNKNIVIENKDKSKNLMEQMKEEQEQNIDFQTPDSVTNANNIINQRRNSDDDPELQMLAPKEVYDHPHEIESLPVEQRDKIDFLIMNAEELHIDTINIKHAFGLTSREYGSKVVEAYYDYDERRYKVEESSEYSYNNNSTNNLEVSGSITNPDISRLDVTDEPDVILAKIEETPDLKGRIELYAKYPEMMDSLPYDDREYYQNIINKYTEAIEKRDSLNKDKQLVKVREFNMPNTNVEETSGFADVAIVISAITFCSGIIATVVMQLLSR